MTQSPVRTSGTAGRIPRWAVWAGIATIVLLWLLIRSGGGGDDGSGGSTGGGGGGGGGGAEPGATFAPGQCSLTNLSHIQFATAIQPGEAPALSDDFPTGTRQILGLLSWACVPEGTALSVQVFRDKELVLTAPEHTVRVASRTDATAEVPLVGHVFTLGWNDPSGWPDGDYLVTVAFGGTVDEYASFSVGRTAGLTWPGADDTGPIPYKAASDVLILTNTAVLRENLGTADTERVVQAAKRVGVVFDLADRGVVRGDARAAADAIRPELSRYRYLLILGNDDAVPFFQLPNPIADEKVYDGIVDVASDDPYTDLDADTYGVPDLPTARIPSSDDVDLLLRQLGDQTLPDGHGFVLLNQQRQREGQAIIDAINAGGRKVDVRYAPPVGPTEFNLQSGSNRYVYALIHGSGRKTDTWWANVQLWTSPQGPPDDQEWIVDGTFQDAAIELADNPGSAGLVQVGACYGAYTIPVGGVAKTAENSLALMYLKSGARAFIADTHLSYSAQQLDDGILRGRTGFEVAFWEAMNKGNAPIDAFFEAKQRIAQATAALYAKGEVSYGQVDEKTIHYMVYLGRP
jgi:hypothetical protein